MRNTIEIIKEVVRLELENVQLEREAQHGKKQERDVAGIRIEINNAFIRGIYFTLKTNE